MKPHREHRMSIKATEELRNSILNQALMHDETLIDTHRAILIAGLRAFAMMTPTEQKLFFGKEY